MNYAQSLQEEPPCPCCSPFKWFVTAPPKVKVRKVRLVAEHKQRLGPRMKVLLKLLTVRPRMTEVEMRPTMGKENLDSMLTRASNYEHLLCHTTEHPYRYWVSDEGVRLLEKTT